MLGQDSVASSRTEEPHIRATLKVRGTSYVSLIRSAWHRTCLLKERRKEEEGAWESVRTGL